MITQFTPPVDVYCKTLIIMYTQWQIVYPIHFVITHFCLGTENYCRVLIWNLEDREFASVLSKICT
jgi:hypothetical protein